MPPSEAQRRANARQDATRVRAPVWLDADTGALLDEIRGDEGRAPFVRA